MLNWAGCLIQSHFYGSFDALENSLSFADKYNYGSFPINVISTNHCKSIGSKAFTRKLLNSIVEDNKIAKSDLDQTSIRFFKLFHNILQHMLNVENVKLVQMETLNKLKNKFHYIERCIRQNNPTFRNPFVDIIGCDEIESTTSRPRIASQKKPSTKTRIESESTVGINVGYPAQFNHFGAYSLVQHGKKSNIITQDQQYFFSHIEKIVFHERTRSQTIHSCSKKYKNRQVSHYVGYAHVGKPEKKREYSFIPNISLTGSIDRVKIGCINERFMASLQNNVKTEIPQESQIMMKEAVIDLRFKRVRYATSKIMVRTQSKYSIDIFIGQLDNIPEYVVDLNQFSNMFETRNQDFLTKC